MFQVEFYERDNGVVPVKDFLDGLAVDLRAKALRSLMILQQEGTRLREPYSKPLTDGIFELRIKYASDIARVFYFFVLGGKIIVTNGFVKKTPKTPPAEIAKAIKYKTDYERRCKL